LGQPWRFLDYFGGGGCNGAYEQAKRTKTNNNRPQAPAAQKTTRNRNGNHRLRGKPHWPFKGKRKREEGRACAAQAPGKWSAANLGPGMQKKRKKTPRPKKETLTSGKESKGGKIDEASSNAGKFANAGGSFNNQKKPIRVVESR